MRYCFALILALAAMPLVAQPDATAKPEVEDSTKEADKKTDELTPAQRLQQFLDTQTELDKEIVGESKLYFYTLGFDTGTLTLKVSHSSYNVKDCYKVEFNTTFDFGIQTKGSNMVAYINAKQQLLYSETTETINKELDNKVVKKRVGDEIQVHVVEPNAEDKGKRDFKYVVKSSPLLVEDYLLPLLLEGKFGKYEHLEWDSDENKVVHRVFTISESEDSASLYSSLKVGEKEGKDSGLTLKIKDKKIISMTGKGVSFIGTNTKQKEPETLSIEEVKKLDTPKKAAIAFFAAIVAKDKELLDNAVNEFELALYFVNQSESAKNMSREVREKIARDRVMPTLLDSFIKGSEKNKDSDLDSGALRLFCCPKFYSVAQILDVWIVKPTEAAKEAIRIKEYRVIKNKETGKYEVAVVIFPDDEDDEPEEEEATE